MANQDKPFGFRPVQTRNGAPWSGKTRAVIVAAADVNAFFVGDMVVLSGNQIQHKLDGKFYEQVTTAAGGVANPEKLAGAITGIPSHQVPSLLYTGYRPAGAQTDDMLVYIPQDRNVVYVVQEDSVGGALSAAASGSNIGFSKGTGDPVTRMSGSELDSNTAAATATLPIRLLSYDGAIDNETGEFAGWYCTVNTDPSTDKTGSTV